MPTEFSSKRTLRLEAGPEKVQATFMQNIEGDDVLLIAIFNASAETSGVMTIKVSGRSLENVTDEFGTTEYILSFAVGIFFVLSVIVTLLWRRYKEKRFQVTPATDITQAS
jgi:hypothetical protein